MVARKHFRGDVGPSSGRLIDSDQSDEVVITFKTHHAVVSAYGKLSQTLLRLTATSGCLPHRFYIHCS